jgi:outer membrane protein assembly factor BamB
MGDLFCLDCRDGSVVWSRNYPRDFGTEINAWGMASAPLVDRQNVIVVPGGKRGSCVMALDKETGKEVWRSLDAEDPGYSSPIIVDSSAGRQLVVWNALGLYGLDPATGEVYWEQSFPTKMGHAIATPIVDLKRRLLFVSSFFDGPLMMQLAADAPRATLLWQGDSHSELSRNTDKLHALMSTPALKDGFLFGVCSYGQLRCLEAQTGERVWETFAATGEGRWSTAFLIRHEDAFFLFNEQGELITADLTPEGYHETSRAPLIPPTAKVGRRTVVWSHPAFAGRCVFARNDQEIVCVDLAASERGERVPADAASR